MGFNLMGAGAWTKKPIPVNLPSGGTYILPSGQYKLKGGLYIIVQWWDPVMAAWRSFDEAVGNEKLVTSDGWNVRLYNPTGTVVGAYVTNGGSGYPNGIYPAGTPQTGSYVVATASAGLATFNVIVGGAVNTSVTITNGGAGYNNPPTLLVSDPPTGGLKATMTATVSGGAITGVTVVNQGAGYTAAPTITVVPHPNDTSITTAAVLTPTLTNSGRVTAVTLGPSGGNGYTTVPTISFAQSAGTTAAATAIACMSVTGVSAVSGGVNLVSASAYFNSIPLATAKTNAPVNPLYEQGLFTPRQGVGVATVAAGAATAVTVIDGGLHETVTVGLNWALNWTTAALAASPVGTLAFGGNSDTVYVTPL